jgi:type VI secretion system secreted protein VgrG
VGVSPGTSVTGFPPGTVRRGTIYLDGPIAAQAQDDANSAYNDLAGQTCNVDLTGQDLGGMTLTPGVYCFDTSAQLTGDLILDALGNPLAVWVFQTGSTLTTASASSVAVINGGQAVNVFWQVGSSATLGTGTRFNGNILADASITLVTGASLIGRALSLHGGVTLDTNGTPFPIANTPLFEFNNLPLIMR